MSVALPSIPEMLSSLVSTPSVSSLHPELDSSNRGVLDHLSNWLEGLGFEVEIHPVPSLDEKFNLVARLGSGEGGMLLSGHTDTVAYDEDSWRFDPLKTTDHFDKIYGLGTCDMKGFFPIALMAAASFSGRTLRKPLTVLATADEETTMAGARHLLDQHPLDADAAVIGEPTSTQPVYAHKGILVLRIQTEGVAGHSSNPSLGLNALEGMHEVLGALLQYREEIDRSYSHGGFEIAGPTLNLGCLHAGDSANRICGHADLLVDIRIVPGMTNEDVLSDIEQRLARVRSAIGMPVSIELGFPPIDPFESSESSRLLAAVQEYSGKPAKTVAYGTEAPFLQQMGIDTVVFGPGSIDQAHQADEYLHKNQIAPTQDVLERLIHDFCC